MAENAPSALADPDNVRTSAAGENPSPERPEPGPGGLRRVAVVVAAQTMSSAPVFLFGGLAVEIRREVPLDQSVIGLMVAGFFATGALGSLAAARASDRGADWSAIRWIMVAVLASHLMLAWIGGTVAGLALALAVAGLANGAIQPYLTLAVARAVSARHQGIAFGIKQSAVPIATIAAGLSLPLIALTFGWRWVFVLFAVMTIVVFALLPRGVAAPSRAASGGALPRGVIPLALACGLAAAGANSMAAFLTVSAVDRGLTPAFAGGLVAAGGVSAIVARVAMGRVVGSGALAPLVLLVGLFLGGAAGQVALALGDGAAMIALGAILGFGLGWGWPGLSVLVSVRLGGSAAGATSATIQAGVFLGAVAGPLAFGWTAEHVSETAAWFGNAAAAAAAGAVTLAVTIGAARRAKARPEAAVTGARVRYSARSGSPGGPST